MMNDVLLHIYLWFEIEEEMIEINVSETGSFHSILNALQNMSVIHSIQCDTAVYEKESQTRCDLDVALYSLNVQNGMIFQVY